MRTFSTKENITATDYLLATPAPNVLRFDVLRTNPDGSRLAYGFTVDLAAIPLPADQLAEAIENADVAVLALAGWDQSNPK